MLIKNLLQLSLIVNAGNGFVDGDPFWQISAAPGE